MEIKETLALVPTVVGGIKTIKETCDSLNLGLFSGSQQRLKSLQEQINQLEEKIQSGFPLLASLTSSYASVAADVKVAKALSDKNEEILRFLKDPTSINVLLIRIPGEMERDCTNIEKRLADLPEINTAEVGEAKRILLDIKRYLDRLRQITYNNSSDTAINDSKEQAVKLLGDMTIQYNELDGILSSLLKRILENIGQAKF